MPLTQWQAQHKPIVDRELSRIVEALRQLDSVRKITLYGSYARGDFSADSDVDLLIIQKTDERFIDRIASTLAVTGARIPVEPIVYTPDEIEEMRARGSGLLADAEREGKVLYERGS